MLPGSDPGHRVSCHWAEEIRDGKIQAHRVVPVITGDDVLAPGTAPEHPGSVTEIFGR